MTIHALIDRLIAREGGYVDHPADRGGATHWGITTAVARANGWQGAIRDLLTQFGVITQLQGDILQHTLATMLIDPQGRIVSIASHATPFSEAPIPSNGAANGVLELRAGRAAEINAKPGDKVLHPYFKP